MHHQVLCQWVLDRAQWDDPDGHCNGQHQMDVWWHQEGTGTNAEQDGPPQICHLGSHHRPRLADGEMGGILFQPLLQREHCDSLSPGCNQVHANHEELNVEPTMDELSKVIDCLATGKAPGSDSIPPDLIKQCKTTLLHPLHEVLCQCWREGAVWQDMRDAKIVTLYKNKGERSNCNNYRGISLLSIIGKVYAQVLLIHLQKLAECVYLESQCGLWAERSMVDMVFSLCQLQEKYREQWMPLYIAFIDLTKAFNLVSSL